MNCNKLACPSWWNCPQRGCYNDALLHYADVTIKRQKENPLAFYDGRDDCTPDGRNIRTTEAKHRQHSLARKDKDE